MRRSIVSRLYFLACCRDVTRSFSTTSSGLPRLSQSMSDSAMILYHWKSICTVSCGSFDAKAGICFLSCVALSIFHLTKVAIRVINEFEVLSLRNSPWWVHRCWKSWQIMPLILFQPYSCVAGPILFAQQLFIRISFALWNIVLRNASYDSPTKVHNSFVALFSHHTCLLVQSSLHH